MARQVPTDDNQDQTTEGPPFTLETYENAQPSERPRRVFVCIGQHCSARGGRLLLAELKRQLGKGKLTGRVQVYTSTCLNLCARAPVLTVYPEGVFYCGLTPRHVKKIVQEHMQSGQIVPHLAVDPFANIRWNDEMDS